MRLEIAGTKAIKYACIHFHYAKCVPSYSLAFSVFNNQNQWCGCIIYGSGANNNLSKSVNDVQGGVIELVRMALNGKQESTGKALSISLRLIPKYAPLVRYVISYADPEQGHIGVLYQATNFFYLGTSQPQRGVIHPKTGKMIHKRTANALFGTIKGLKKTDIFFKHKYAYGITKESKDKLKALSKDYPKNAALDHKGDH